MKIRQSIDSQNQHVVALEKDNVFRCYFRSYSLQAACEAFTSLSRDISRHGEAVVDFAALPEIACRTSKKGRMIFDVM